VVANVQEIVVASVANGDRQRALGRAIGNRQKHRFALMCHCSGFGFVGGASVRQGFVPVRASGSMMRWCQIHGLVIGSAKRKMHNFITYEDEGDDVDKLRIQRLPPKWSSELRLVSKLSFMLPLCTPTDLVAVAVIGPPCDGGVAVSPLWVCTVFLAQTIKWPAVVRKWYQLCREGPATCASDFVTHYVAVVKWACGRDWGDMSRRMDGGLQHAQTGLAVNAQALGIVKSCRKRSKTTVDGIKDVLLGPLNAPHVLNEDLAPAIDIVQHIIT